MGLPAAVDAAADHDCPHHGAGDVLPHGRGDGQGLSDLIREEFGLRVTFVVMSLLVLVNLANIMANFAGIAGSLELFHISRYFSVPAGAVAVWLLVNKGTYQSVE